MLTVEQAFDRIVGQANPLSTEQVAVADAVGRVIASPIAARRSQPGTDLSAMDGYAVLSADLDGNAKSLTVIGESAAGHPFGGEIVSGQTVRIFTGAAMPKGADQVIIQENVVRNGNMISVQSACSAGEHIRFKGIDFLQKQTVLDGGTYMSPKTIGLAASAGQSHLMVYRAPKVAILSTGDELADPGKKAFTDYETVDSVRPQISALLREAGAEVIYSGHARDTVSSLTSALEQCRGADIVVTLGGASVGDKDLVQKALADTGMTLDFWKVAMRPGKPLIFGKNNNQYVLGLPGNPVSAFVCALIYLRPLVDRLMGRPAPQPSGVALPVATDLPENGMRTHYIRARLIGESGSRHIDPAADQDSSLLTVLAQCDGLIIRPVDAPAVSAGDMVPFLPF
jgi:molybdopterin molybdotransferase